MLASSLLSRCSDKAKCLFLPPSSSSPSIVRASCCSVRACPLARPCSFREEAKNLPDAYERLILDVARGDHNLFVRADEVGEDTVCFGSQTPTLNSLPSFASLHGAISGWSCWLVEALLIACLAFINPECLL